MFKFMFPFSRIDSSDSTNNILYSICGKTLFCHIASCSGVKSGLKISAVLVKTEETVKIVKAEKLYRRHYRGTKAVDSNSLGLFSAY